MGLLSFLNRQPNDTRGAPVGADAPDSVQQARVRARQRVVGALVLVVGGVVGFSMLFAGPARTLPTDVPIEVVRSDKPASAKPAPSTRAAPTLPPGVVTEDRNAAAAALPEPEPVPPVVAAAPTAVPEPVPAAPPKPAAKPPEPKPTPKPAEPKPVAAKPTDAARAQALLDGKPAAASGRFVVQVGAFADNAAANDARKKVERLGLKSFTQKVDTSAGSRVRVRVGPFSSREEADRAAGRVKSAGLPSAVMPL